MSSRYNSMFLLASLAQQQPLHEGDALQTPMPGDDTPSAPKVSTSASEIVSNLIRMNGPFVYADSVADRVPSARKRGSKIGTICDPIRMRKVHYESGLEEKHLHALMINPRVSEIREQQTFNYFLNGKKRKYTADFLVDLEGVGWILYEVKYKKDVVKQNVEEKLRAVLDCNLDYIAETRILHELHISENASKNAEDILWCAREHDMDAQEIVIAYLKKAEASVTLCHIGLKTGLGIRGVRAAKAIMPFGLLSFDANEPMTNTTKLINRYRQK